MNVFYCMERPSLHSPGVVFPVGDVSGGVRGEGADVDGGFVRLRAGEDVLACATAGTELSSDATNGAASSRDVFLFATWTAPATIVKFAVDDATQRCVLVTLVPIRPRRRGERRSLRTFAGVSLRPSLAFNPRPRRLSTPTDAFQLHPD